MKADPEVTSITRGVNMLSAEEGENMKETKIDGANNNRTGVFKSGGDQRERRGLTGCLFEASGLLGSHRNRVQR